MASLPPKLPDDTSAGDLLRQTSTIVYMAMGAIGAMIMHFAHQNLAGSMMLPASLQEGLRFLALAMLGCGVMLTASFLFEELFPSYSALKRTMIYLMGPLPWWMVIYLALLSGVGEELLFRGAIQPFAGLALTSILFGLLHMGPQGFLSAWSVWAALAGLMLGWMFDSTGSLWPPIICHVLVNGISMARMKVLYQRATPPLGNTSATTPANPVDRKNY